MGPPSHAAHNAITGTTASGRETLEELNEVKWTGEKWFKADSESEDVRRRAVSIEKIGAATGVRTQDIRCHRAAFCH